MTVLDEIQAGIGRLAEGAGRSVVGIGQRWGAGSGIVLGDGQVLTNAHNVRGDSVEVTFADGRTAEGTVAGHDVDGDLAVISVDTAGAPALPWADGAGPSIGLPVFALVRSWCGAEAVDRFDELVALRAEVARLGELVERAVDALRKRGAAATAATLERGLGVPIATLTTGLRL